MLPNRLILGWCLGVLVVSIGGAAVAMPSGIGPTEFLPVEFPSFESFAVSTSSPIPLVPPAMRVTQNASDRNSALASIPNTANVSLQMSPNQSVSVGTKISFRVTTKKPGYLVLVDIDANEADRRSLAHACSEFSVQRQIEIASIGQSGQRVVHGQVFGLFFGQFSLRYIVVGDRKQAPRINLQVSSNHHEPALLVRTVARIFKSK